MDIKCVVMGFGNITKGKSIEMTAQLAENDLIQIVTTLKSFESEIFKRVQRTIIKI
jgi:hypothetical protein